MPKKSKKQSNSKRKIENFTGKYSDYIFILKKYFFRDQNGRLQVNRRDQRAFNSPCALKKALERELVSVLEDATPNTYTPKWGPPKVCNHNCTRDNVYNCLAYGDVEGSLAAFNKDARRMYHRQLSYEILKVESLPVITGPTKKYKTEVAGAGWPSTHLAMHWEEGVWVVIGEGTKKQCQSLCQEHKRLGCVGANWIVPE